MTDTAMPEASALSEAVDELPATASLYDRLGGAYAVAGAVDVLVDRLFLNAKVMSSLDWHAHHTDTSNGPGYKFLVTGWSIEAACCYP